MSNHHTHVYTIYGLTVSVCIESTLIVDPIKDTYMHSVFTVELKMLI